MFEAVPSLISSMPLAASASISFISESIIAADNAVACFHALDGGKRKPRALSQFTLVEAEQGAGGSQLGGGNHAQEEESFANGDRDI